MLALRMDAARGGSTKAVNRSMRLRNEVLSSDIETAFGRARAFTRVRGLEAMFRGCGFRFERAEPLAIEVAFRGQVGRVELTGERDRRLAAFIAAPLAAIIVARLARRRERRS